MIAEDLLMALDPVAFAQSTGLEPDAWQQQVLLSHRNVLMLAGRQVGKTTCAALLCLHHVLYVPGSLVILLGAAQRQPQEHLKRIQALYNALKGPPATMVQDSETRLAFSNGSRLLALPGGTGATIRGYTPSLLCIDEAAYTQDELWTATIPMILVSQGRVVAMSTPLARQGWFYQQWSENEQDWLKINVTSPECPRVTPEMLEQMRRTLTDYDYRREILCAFTDSASSVFSTELIEAALSDEVEEWRW